MLARSPGKGGTEQLGIVRSLNCTSPGTCVRGEGCKNGYTLVGEGNDASQSGQRMHKQVLLSCAGTRANGHVSMITCLKRVDVAQTRPFYLGSPQEDGCADAEKKTYFT